MSMIQNIIIISKQNMHQNRSLNACTRNVSQIILVNMFIKLEVSYSSNISDNTTNHFYSFQRVSCHLATSDNSVPEEGRRWWLKR